MNIVEIEPRENGILFIRTEDGRTGFFDVRPYLESEAFSPLKDRKEFERLRNGKYFVEWECGADLSADTILARWTSDPSKGVHSRNLVSKSDKPTVRAVQSSESNRSRFTGEKSYDVVTIRHEFNQAYTPWSEEDDAYLRKRCIDGATIADLVSEFGRHPGGIRSRLRKLGLDL